MKIWIASVFVDDQSKALDFYTRVLGFKLKNDVPMGEHRWLTVVSPENPQGAELLLEPSEHPAVKPYKGALVEDGIPATSFQQILSTPWQHCSWIVTRSLLRVARLITLP